MSDGPSGGVGAASPEVVLTLLSLPQVGPRRGAQFLRAADDPLDASSDLLELLHRSPAATQTTEGFTEADVESARSKAKEVLDACDDLGIDVLGPGDLPSRLSAHPDAPLLLYAKGDFDPVRERSVGVIGTREASDPARRFCREASEALAERGISIVSGLAFGCDTAAHEGALDADGHTLAVLAHGLDTIAPPSQEPLGRRILDKGGALVSEYPPGTEPKGYRFAERDRIQAGLAACVVVGETTLDGGSMNAIDAARDGGRPVLAYHPEGEELNRGLVGEGLATPFPSSEELVEHVVRSPQLFDIKDPRSEGDGRPEERWF